MTAGADPRDELDRARRIIADAVTGLDAEVRRLTALRDELAEALTVVIAGIPIRIDAAVPVDEVHVLDADGQRVATILDVAHEHQAAAEPAAVVELVEVRLGGRNYLRVDDLVRVKPSRPGRRDGFVGRVRRIYRDTAGELAVEVYGGPSGRAKATRTLRTDKLARTQAQEPTQ